MQQSRQILPSERVAAPDVRLEIRHQERRGDSLARDVGEDEAEPAVAQVEEVVVVAADRACLAAGACAGERAERGGLLRKQPALDLLRNLELPRLTALHFPALGDALRQPDAVEREARLIAHRRQQSPVFARVRLLGEPGPEREQPRDALVAPDHR